jgi:hypothetical protein
MQPAPIQVSYMGFPATTGANYIDYLITDEVKFLKFFALSYLNGNAFLSLHINLNLFALAVCLSVKIFSYILRKACPPSSLLLCK